MKKIILLFIIIWASNLANSQTNKKKSTVKSVRYTEEKALELIADYYEFYNADEEYDNPVVRQISNNVFYVKVQYCDGGKETCYESDDNDETVKRDFFWSSKVLVLKIQSSTKYTVTVKTDY
jgi:hypothetical protein